MKKRIWKFAFLSQDFYKDYPAKQYPEIERKSTRPYAVFLVKIDELIFAIPLRSGIKHNYSFITDKTKKDSKCGLDYSKSVVISKESYIDNLRKPYIRPIEFNALRHKEYAVISKFRNYLNKYKNIIENGQNVGSVYKYSTLQYFHQELKLSLKTTLS